MADGEKHVQFGTDLDADDRTEIADHLKDALWADAVDPAEHDRQVAALAGLSPADRAAVAELHRATVVAGIRA